MTDSMIQENSTKELFVKCFDQQLSEFELLKSMYPNDDEIVLTDHDILEKIHFFMQNQCEYMPNNLDYTVNLHVDGIKLEVCVNLPSLYPEEEPDIYVRCNQLNRYQESKLNSDLLSYIKDQFLGEVCLFTAISWLQENVNEYMQKEQIPVDLEDDQLAETCKDNFTRVWVYSHHIYNKSKRDDIARKAKEFDLTGFCLPGKPGVVCIEGLDHDCKEWWKYIKSLNWKKIVIRKVETFNYAEQNSQRRFANFVELSFLNRTVRSTKHSDMSEFSKFMEQHGLGDAFNEVFGFNNDNAKDNN